MTKLTNEDRAEHAATGLDAYAIAKEGRADYDAPEAIGGDMLVDLLHLIQLHGADPIASLDMARINFEAEQEGATDDRARAVEDEPDTTQAVLLEALGYCESWFSKFSPHADLITGDKATHPMLECIRNALTTARGEA